MPDLISALLGRTALLDGGEGFFVYDSADDSTADDGATVLVNTDGDRFKRMMMANGIVSAAWWGAKGDWTSNGNYTTDNTDAINAAIEFCYDLGGGTVILPTGKYAITGTVWLRQRVKLCGTSVTGSHICGETTGMHMLRGFGDPTGYQNYVKLEELFVYSEKAEVGVNYSGCSYSTFRDVVVQLKGSHKTCWYGEGNTGSSPYYNVFDNIQAHGDNLAGTGTVESCGIRNRSGAWDGSAGANRNHYLIRHMTALDYGVDHESGNGCTFDVVTFESIQDEYFRFNNNPTLMSGTATGGTSTTLVDSNRANGFVTPDSIRTSYFLELTGGTGAGQRRKISEIAANTLTISGTFSPVPSTDTTYRISPEYIIQGTATSADGRTITDTAINFENEGVAAGVNQIRCFSGTANGECRKISGVSGSTLTVDVPWTVTPSVGSQFTVSRTRAVGIHIIRGAGEGTHTADPNYVFLRPGADQVTVGPIFASSLGAGMLIKDEAAAFCNGWPGTPMQFAWHASFSTQNTTTELAPVQGASTVQGGWPVLQDFALQSVVATCGGRTAGTATITLTAGGDTIATLTLDADRPSQAVWYSHGGLTRIPELRNISCAIATSADWTATENTFAVVANCRTSGV